MISLPGVRRIAGSRRRGLFLTSSRLDALRPRSSGGRLFLSSPFQSSDATGRRSLDFGQQWPSAAKLRNVYAEPTHTRARRNSIQLINYASQSQAARVRQREHTLHKHALHHGSRTGKAGGKKTAITGLVNGCFRRDFGPECCQRAASFAFDCTSGARSSGSCSHSSHGSSAQPMRLR